MKTKNFSAPLAQLLFFLILVLSSFYVQKTYSQTSSEFQDIRERQVQNLLEDLDSLEKEVKSVEGEEDLLVLEEKKQQIMLSLLETLGQTSFRQKSRSELEEKTTLSDDIKEIISPFVDTIKTLSRRPRLIDELNDRVSSYKQILIKLDLSEEKILVFFKEHDQPKLKTELLDYVKSRRERAKRELNEAQFELFKMENDRGGSLNAVSDYIFKFFKTKGLNLLIAAGAFLLIFWPLRLLKKPFLYIFMRKLARINKSKEKGHWLQKPVSVIYSLLSVMAAFAVSILVLYILNDWVLVTFILLSLFAIAWSSRSAFQKYAQSLKFILNLGNVRQGERVVYNGLPWKVQGIGFYCRLVNPDLSGGSVRVKASELMDLYARYCDESEPWFPTQKGDWVELADETFGKVLLQSPEFVRVKLVGEQSKTFLMRDFLELRPINLSHGFGIELPFGIDRNHGANINSQLMLQLKSYVWSRLESDFASGKEHLLDLSVEFKSFGSSSLDLRAFLRCGGQLASHKQQLRRKLNTYLLEACSKYDIVIPFNQLTLRPMTEGHETETTYGP